MARSSVRGQKRCEKAIFWGEGRAVWHVGVLVPQLGSKPMPPAGEAKFFITGTPGKSQRSERRWEKIVALDHILPHRQGMEVGVSLTVTENH